MADKEVCLNSLYFGVFIWYLGKTLPALVGNKRVHRGVGDVLVITYQETALLPLPATVMEGPPQKRRGSKAF